MALVTLTPATALPVSLEELKRHLRIEDDEQNHLLVDLLTAAVAVVELDTGRQIMPATFRLDLPRWKKPLLLPKAPVASITTVRYYSPDDTLEADISGNFLEELAAIPPSIAPAPGYALPALSRRADAVQVAFVAGYTTAALVPEALKIAVRMLAGYLFRAPWGAEDDSQRPMGYEGLIRHYRIGWVFE